MSKDILQEDIYAYLILKSFNALFGDFLDVYQEECIINLERQLKEKAKTAREELYNRGYKSFSAELKLCLLSKQKYHLHTFFESE